MNYNPFSLEGRTILVTGASSGIGRAIAIECSRMGARLIIHGRSEDRLSETYKNLSGENHLMILGDLTSEEGRKELCDSLPELDGVVFNAGIEKRQLCRMVKEEDIYAILNVNFTSIALLQKSLLKKKKLTEGASIVMMASRAAFAPSIGNAIYSASKGALISYAKVLGLEVASRRMRVNCICPGMVFTELTRRDAEMYGVDLNETQKSYPLGRLGIPEDIAYLTVYLLSNASQWMTGSCIDISGGGMMVLS